MPVIYVLHPVIYGKSHQIFLRYAIVLVLGNSSVHMEEKI